jgi:hypothetical protein
MRSTGTWRATMSRSDVGAENKGKSLYRLAWSSMIPFLRDMRDCLFSRHALCPSIRTAAALPPSRAKMSPDAPHAETPMTIEAKGVTTDSTILLVDSRRYCLFRFAQYVSVP